MSFLDNFKGKDKKKKNENPLKNVKNPFAQVGKAMTGQNRKFAGQGESLGGSRPGKLLHMTIPEDGPVGVQVEKRPNKSAIVSLVVAGSQAEKAGIQRGDILCYANTNGEEEISYDGFLQLAASKERPLVFDVRRVESKSSSSSANTTKESSADAYARKQAMIAAAEAREKAHKQKMKPIPKGKESTFAKQRTVPSSKQGSDTPLSEEAKRAAAQAKADESAHAAQLGYNPYETSRATAGQARNATVAMTHGTIANKDDKAPNKPSAPPSLPSEAVSPEFEDAYTLLVTTNDETTVKSSINIMCKLIVNATTKGQDSSEDSAKFRKVRLSNEKIKAAITDVNGGLDLMQAVGFQLAEDDGETFLVYPSGEPGPDWLPESLEQMQSFAKS
jgi:hypothetical protein